MTKREIDPGAKISPHFWWRAYTRSATAKRMGIRNVIYIGSEEESSAKALFMRAVEPVRVAVDHPLFITSGYRCEELNAAVGGVPTSEHRLARAVDLVSERLEPVELARAFIDCEVPFNELILEHDQDVVHVSHGPDNRHEVLTRYYDGDALKYVTGLVAEEAL